MKSSLNDRAYKPRLQVEDRKASFNKLNAFVTARDGFVISVPGATEIVFRHCPTALPEELRNAGYNIKPVEPPERQRILSHAIVEWAWPDIIRRMGAGKGAQPEVFPPNFKILASIPLL
jgi:hypothetical protein